MLKLLLTHTPPTRRQYYGQRVLAELEDLVEVDCTRQTKP
jgi:hypothetical protein